ncbi:MAG: hypothetical protein P4N59_30045 [Negativicutes bacterium]|nr:hypothetical protein [Negativicutes bacterium]
MSILRLATRVMARSSPLVLAAGGLVIGLSIPAVRHTIRRGAILAVGGIIAVADAVKPLGNELAKIIEEAKMVGEDVIKLEGDAAALITDGEKLAEETII